MTALAAILVLAVSCAGAAAGAERVKTGQWGGRGVLLEVTRKGARLELDCAHGAVKGPLALGVDARFEAKGMFVRERPGPVRVGEETEGEAARYVGVVQGERMTLEIVLTRTKETVGRFTLERDKPPRLRKCL